MMLMLNRLMLLCVGWYNLMGIIRESFGLLLTTGNSNDCIIVEQGTKVVKGHFTILKIVPHEFLIRTVT